MLGGMKERNEILRNPLLWFVKAVGMGFLTSSPVALVLYGWAPRRILIFGGIGALFCVVMWAGGVLSGPWIYRSDSRLSPTRFALRAQLRWLLVYGALLGFVVLVLQALLGINMVRNLRDLAFTGMLGYLISSVILGFKLTAMVAEKSRELEAAHTRATLLALRAQLSPHTLFNGLNTVAALIPEEPRKAEAVVEGLSRLLRRILEALERETWTLAEEFDLLRDLLELEQARFGERLTVALHLEEDEASRAVPPLVLLPLVENALKHGFRPKVGPCHLEVRTEGNRVWVMDDGVGRAPDAPEGLGLRTVRTRLEAHGGTLSWMERPQGTAVEVAWP